MILRHISSVVHVAHNQIAFCLDEQKVYGDIPILFSTILIWEAILKDINKTI